MMLRVVGLPLALALERLREQGLCDVSVVEARLPRENSSRGALRVIRVDDGGKRILVNRFTDTVEESGDEA